MSPELARQVIDGLDQGLDEIETICVHFYGGEPLLNLAAMEAMVDRAAHFPSERFQFSITTNGTVDTPAAFALLDAGNFQVILSIDGPREIHDHCRRTVTGRGSHGRVLGFLDQLRSRTRCTVRGSAVVRSGWGLANAEAYLRTLPVHHIKAQAVRVPPGAPFDLTAQERDRYLSDLEAIGRTVIDDLEHDRLPKDDRFSSRVLQLLTGRERTTYCGAGRSNFGITPDGTVLPCLLLDIEDNRLGQIDEAPASWRAAGAHWTSVRKPGRECEECPALPLCGGGCPAIGSVCGENECQMVRKNCDVAHMIWDHFRDCPETLLGLAGIF